MGKSDFYITLFPDNMFNGVSLKNGFVTINSANYLNLLRIESSLSPDHLSTKLQQWLLEFVIIRPDLVVTDKVYHDGNFEYQTKLETRCDFKPNIQDFVHEFIKFLDGVKDPIYVSRINLTINELSRVCLSKDRDLYLRVVMARRNKN